MNIDWQNIFQTVLPFLPSEIAGDLTLISTFLISLCAVIARFWARPAEGSKWLSVYNLINTVGMNSKHAANADDKKTP